MDGAADVAQTTYTPFRTEPGAAPVRLIVRRVKPTPGSHWPSSPPTAIMRDGETLELEADHHRHEEPVSVFVAPGSLEDQDGNLYTGLLSITEVPPDLTPAALLAGR